MKERPVCGDEWTEGGLRSSSQGGKPRPDEIPTADTAPKYHRQKMGPTQGENAEKIKKRVFQTLRILWGSTLLHIVYNICYRVSMQNYNTEPFIISLFLYSLFISHYMILINQAFSISHRIQQYGERNVN